MDDVAFLHERIDSYADYTNADARRRSDQQIRAYVGEALADVRRRLAPSGADGEALERLLLRCEFADQDDTRVYDALSIGSDIVAATAAADRELVGLADEAAALDAAGLETLLARINAAFDRRWKNVGTTSTSMQPPIR